MKNLDKIAAEQVMNDSPKTASTDQSISQIKHKMEENNLRAIPVVDDKNRYQGVIGYRDLIRHVQFNPEHTGLDKVMHKAPEFDSQDSLLDLADLRINSGRKLLVNLQGKKLHGVIGDREFAPALAETAEIDSIKTNEIHTYDLETVYEEDSLEEARHIMLDNGISRLPVIDENGNLTGIIRSTDLLQMMVPREKPSTGGRSGGATGYATDESTQNTQEPRGASPERGGVEKQEMSNVTVDQLMQRNPLISSEHMNAVDALEKMIDREEFEMIFVDDNYPESIVTLKDYLEFAGKTRQRDTVFVNIVGLELKEERAFIQNIVERQLHGSLGRKLEKPEELKLRFKKSDSDGNQHRYELDIQLVSEFGVISISEEDWDLNDVVDEALNELNTVVRKKKEERSEHRR